jgi:hypothetical protein
MLQRRANQTVFARAWLIPTILLLSSISGCATFSLFDKEPDVKPIEIIKKSVEKTPLNLPMSDPLKLESVNWRVVTPENIDKVWEELGAEGGNVVLFALTEDGYKTLSLNFAQIRNFILTQNEMLIKYRLYYEPEKKQEQVKE